MTLLKRNHILQHLWWTFTGVAWLCLGYILLSVCIGHVIILCGWLNDSKNMIVAITGNVVLGLYTLCFAIYTLMLVAVASPQPWFAAILLLMAVINTFVSIKNIQNLRPL